MNKAVILTILASAIVLAGCGTTGCPKPGPYLEAQPEKPLAIPPDLNNPAAGRSMTIPEGGAAVHVDLRGQAYQAPDGSMRCLETPPPMRTVEPRAR